MTPADVSPDPVAEPSAYQEYLLALLNDDDPAVAQESTGASLRELAREADGHLYQQPAPGEWSLGR